MKIIVLVDDSLQTIEKMIDGLENKKSFFIDTADRDKTLREDEYQYLVRYIAFFLRSDDEVMLIRYSGDKSIARDLGDEYSQMVISLSCNRNSGCYVEHPVKTFLDLLTIFKKGDQLQNQN